MRTSSWTLAALLALALIPAVAKPPAPAASAPSATAHSATVSEESQLIEHGHYTNSSGAVVHSPAHTITGQAPAGASAKCRDGTFSFSQHHRGTCARHGGVDAWL